MLPKFDLTDPKASLSVLEDVTTNVKQIQDSILEAILSRNAHTEYLKGFLNGQVDKESFKKNVPLVTYKDIRPYIDRIADVEQSDLICDRPITVLLTRYMHMQLRYFRRSSKVDSFDSRGFGTEDSIWITL